MSIKAILKTPIVKDNVIITVSDISVGKYLFPKGYEFKVVDIVTETLDYGIGDSQTFTFYNVKSNVEDLDGTVFTVTGEHIINLSDIPKKVTRKKTTTKVTKPEE